MTHAGDIARQDNRTAKILERAHRYNRQNMRVRDTEWGKGRIKKPWGQYPEVGKMSSSEMHYLYATVVRLGEGNYANLGTFRGKSAACMAFGLKEIGATNSKVYAVDLFDWDDTVMDTITRYFEECGISQYLELCKGSTVAWGKKFKDRKKFKFVLIDADHSYEATVNDYVKWSPLIEEGGELAIHDTHAKEVNQAIRKVVLQEWKLYGHYYTMKGFRRK